MYLTVAILLGVMAWVFIYLYLRRRTDMSSPPNAVLGVLLMGPLFWLFKDRQKKGKQLILRREALGLLLVAIVLIAAVAFVLITGSGSRFR